MSLFDVVKNIAGPKIIERIESELADKRSREHASGYSSYIYTNIAKIAGVLSDLQSEAEEIIRIVRSLENRRLARKEKQAYEELIEKAFNDLAYLYLSRDFFMTLSRGVLGIALTRGEQRFVELFVPQIEALPVAELGEYNSVSNKMYGRFMVSDIIFFGKDRLIGECGQYVEKYRELIYSYNLPDIDGAIQTFVNAVTATSSPDVESAQETPKADTPDSSYCTKCGSIIPLKAKFCPNCGAKIGAGSVPPEESEKPKATAENYGVYKQIQADTPLGQEDTSVQSGFYSQDSFSDTQPNKKADPTKAISIITEKASGLLHKLIDGQDSDLPSDSICEIRLSSPLGKTAAAEKKASSTPIWLAVVCVAILLLGSLGSLLPGTSEHNDNRNSTQPSNNAYSSGTPVVETNYTIPKGSEYAFMSGEYDVYIATAVTESIVKIEHWEKNLLISKNMSFESSVGTFRINDPENGFSWVDDAHTAFSFNFQVKNINVANLLSSRVFTINISKEDTFKGTNYNEDIDCYLYRCDDWHIYRAIPLTSHLIKFECWSRALAVGSFNYGWDWCVIDPDNNDIGFEWTDDEHTSFMIVAQDEQNETYWSSTRHVLFELENPDAQYLSVLDYLNDVKNDSGSTDTQQSSDTQPNDAQPDAGQPADTKPEDTQPDNTEPEDTQSNPAPMPEYSILTIDNNDDLAALLTSEHLNPDAQAEFVKKYKGKTIEFDCLVYTLEQAPKSTWVWSYILVPGADSDHMGAAFFMIDQVTFSAFHWDSNTRPEYLTFGSKIRIRAEVKSGDDPLYIYLKPIKTWGR